MGNKISTYTAITTLANGDLLDISKDMGASTYATRKITYANLLVELQTDMTFSYANITPMTSSQLASIISDETGTGALVFATSPTLVTPSLGVATATSINGNIFSGAINSTWNLSNNKTFSVSNTISFSGTDGTSFIFPSGNGTIARLSDIPAASNLGSANLTSSDDARTFTLKTGTTATQNFQIKNSAGKTGLYFDGVSRVMLRTSTVPADIAGEPVNLVLGDTTNEITCNMYLTTTGASQYFAWRIYSGSSVLTNVDSRGEWAYKNMNDNSKVDVSIRTFGNGPRITTDSNNGGYWVDGYLHTHGANEMVKIGTTGQQNGYIIVNNSSGTVKNIISGKRSLEPTWFGEGAQIGGTRNSINASALLDLQSTTQGLGLPSMTTAQKNAISSPRAGLLVFDDDLNQISYYTGAAWVNL